VRGTAMAFKPSPEEQNWAKRQEMDIRKKLREFIGRHKDLDLPEVGTVCPSDGKPLEKVEIEGTGVSVHKCSFCGGIWIDRGDMERLIHSVNRTDKLVKYLSKLFNINI
jgi:hypothetical protein